jgi:uncharacterized protein with PIN domain
MSQAIFRFFAELNDFLIRNRRGISFEYSFTGNPSVKHLIEAFRVPHTEVGIILANGVPVDFSYLVQNGDLIYIQPVSLDTQITPQSISSQKPNVRPLFLLDNHLGKLATYLRMLGFDVLYRNDYQDAELAILASQEKRILLTRDRGLLMRRAIQQGYCVRKMIPKEQLIEVVKRYNLLDKIQPFQRCLRCNGLLCPVSKEDIIDRLEPLTRLYYDEFHLCSNCDQIYWKGSHYERMRRFLEEIRERQEI